MLLTPSTKPGLEPKLTPLPLGNLRPNPRAITPPGQASQDRLNSRAITPPAEHQRTQAKSETEDEEPTAVVDVVQARQSSPTAAAALAGQNRSARKQSRTLDERPSPQQQQQRFPPSPASSSPSASPASSLPSAR